ncbi:MAG: transketolase [Atopobiaceae bacterium]|nr:transketolase [Atopobiaceae bacterium]MBQ9317720.1 transketolase [Atopobiaceae bacterium]
MSAWRNWACFFGPATVTTATPARRGRTDTETVMHRDVKDIAKQMRVDIIEMLAAAGSGHPGGSLSACDILAVLYFEKMNVDPSNPEDPDRDRLVLAKGHAAPALYAALAEKGFFPRKDLITLRKSSSYLQGHPNMNITPGVEMSTGSLGQGLSVANGMALAGRLDGRDYYVYCVMGDGEIQEGQVWEAAMSAAHCGLDHVIAFVDHNHLQIDGNNDEVMTVNPIEDKFRAFGWHVLTIDGHDYDAISEAVETAKETKGKPTLIVAETVKGKGVSFMENQVGWHGVAPNAEQAEKALAELRA